MFCLPRSFRALIVTIVATSSVNLSIASASPVGGDYVPGYGAWYFPKGFCTWFAATEFNRVSQRRLDFGGHAGNWIKTARDTNWTTSSNPRDAKPGAIVVWSGGQFGHVGIVRKVSGDQVVIDEMNGGSQTLDSVWGKTDEFNRAMRRTYSLNKNLRRGSMGFAGFIFPERSTMLAQK